MGHIFIFFLSPPLSSTYNAVQNHHTFDGQEISLSYNKLRPIRMKLKDELVIGIQSIGSDDEICLHLEREKGKVRIRRRRRRKEKRRRREGRDTEGGGGAKGGAIQGGRRER